jgi:hypothetical protein
VLPSFGTPVRKRNTLSDFTFPVTSVPVVGTGRRKFAQLMPNHILTDKNWDELSAIMYGKSQANKFRDNGRTA